ncbi:hypothetical protein SteCoe_27967 [Stentor coeruleus]|uniref:ubiquitinyl hydrolase 1 n=1 Tax=Stentor coeruleus TaxID=5963 RepID=A0A1R2B9C0_9CILI|nr:hypothetical protein SteCoe_27967 [Stentor coeruleus]
MSHNIDPKVLQEIVEMGIPHEHAVRALKLYKTKEKALEELIPSQIKSFQTKTSIDDLAQAIQNSLNEVDIDYAVYDIANPETLLRFENLPVGLKNIGNTCYFNSLVQTYFNIPKFVKEILSFRADPKKNTILSPVQLASIRLIQELQFLFASMILGNKKYIDPGNVLDCLVDDSGNKIVIGEQKDVGEFNMNLVARIEEGLKIVTQIENIDEIPEVLDESKLESNIVSQLFYAKQHEFVTAKEPDGENLTFNNTTIFGQLSLDVDQKELYRAWDNAYRNYIEEFTTPSGHKTFALQEIWPEKLPGILLFQIQRVRYDPKAKQSVKINSPFVFPLQLYGDRFILKNKHIYLKIKDKLFGIKSEIEKLESQLKAIENYQGSGISIIDILDSTNAFMDNQEYSIIASNEESQFDLPKSTDSQWLATSEILDYYKDVIKKQRNQIMNQIIQLEQELEQLHDKPELKMYEYKLHTILVHEGRAETGHYYAYIFDIEEKIWKKYSDTFIKVVTLEEVMANSVGGSGEASAYCLIYIYKPFIENQGVFKDLTENKLENYASIIPNDVKTKVLEDNQKFLDEIDRFKAKQITDRIKVLYDNRFSMLINWTSDSELNEKPLINFPMFLRCSRNDSLARWVLLNTCIKETISKDLKKLTQDLLLYETIDNNFCHYSFGPKSLDLTDFEERALDDLALKFKYKYFNAKISIYILEKLTSEDLISAFQAIMHQLERAFDLNEEYLATAFEGRKVIALRMSSFINGCVYDKDIIQSIVWAKHLAFVTSTIDDQNFVFVIKNRLKNTVAYMKKYLPNYYNVDVKAEFEGILSSIENLVALPTFDTSIIDPVLKKIINENIVIHEWMDHRTTIAWEYGKVYRKYTESFIWPWVWLVRRCAEKSGMIEQEIRDVEKNNGIVEKNPW